MLRTNLATRPFYNERAVHVGIALAALLVAAITMLNVVRIVSLSRHSTELSGRTSTEQSEAARLTREAAEIRKTIDKDELDVVVNAAREANTLIDQRTFSWTAFFNYVEEVLPADAMLTSVRPSFTGERAKVSMAVMARRPEDVDELMEKLEETGAFEDVIPAQQDRTDEGLYRVLIESYYVGHAEAAAQPAAGTPAPKSSAATKPAGRGGRQ